MTLLDNVYNYIPHGATSVLEVYTQSLQTLLVRPRLLRLPFRRQRADSMTKHLRRCLGVVGLQRFDQAPDQRVLVTHQVLQVDVPPFCVVVCSIASVDGRLEHVPRRRRELGQLTAHTARLCGTDTARHVRSVEVLDQWCGSRRHHCAEVGHAVFDLVDRQEREAVHHSAEQAEVAVLFVRGGQAKVLQLPPRSLRWMEEAAVRLNAVAKYVTEPLHRSDLEVSDDSCWPGRAVQLSTAAVDGGEQLSVRVLRLALHQRVHARNGSIGQRRVNISVGGFFPTFGEIFSAGEEIFSSG